MSSRCPWCALRNQPRPLLLGANERRSAYYVHSDAHAQWSDLVSPRPLLQLGVQPFQTSLEMTLFKRALKH